MAESADQARSNQDCLSDDLWRHILIFFQPTVHDSYADRQEKIRTLRTICLVSAAACRVSRGLLLNNVTINLLSPWEMNTFLQFLYRFPEDAKLVRDVLLIMDQPWEDEPLTIFDEEAAEEPQLTTPSRLTPHDIQLITRTAIKTASTLSIYPPFFEPEQLMDVQADFIEELQSDPRRPFLCEDPAWSVNDPSSSPSAPLTAKQRWIRDHGDTVWQNINTYCTYLAAICPRIRLIEILVHQNAFEYWNPAVLEVTSPVKYHLRVSTGLVQQYGWNKQSLRERFLPTSQTSFSTPAGFLAQWNNSAILPESIVLYEMPLLHLFDTPGSLAGTSCVRELVLCFEDKEQVVDFSYLSQKLIAFQGTLERLIVRAVEPGVAHDSEHRALGSMRMFEQLQELTVPLMALLHGSKVNQISDHIVRDKLPRCLRHLTVTAQQYHRARTDIEPQLRSIMMRTGILTALTSIKVNKPLDRCWVDLYEGLSWELGKATDKSKSVVTLLTRKEAA